MPSPFRGKCKKCLQDAVRLGLNMRRGQLLRTFDNPPWHRTNDSGMDAATLGAAMAAITTRRMTRSAASEALSIAVENLKPSYRIAKTLAMALRRSFWNGFETGDHTYALARAGERMIVYDDIRKEYHAALESVFDMEEKLPWPTEGWQPELDEQTRLRLHTAEIALKLAEEERAC